MRKRRPVIAIDGPAASGKSTAGKAVAARLGYLYIDTGALYRAAAWLADRNGISPENPGGLADLIERTGIGLESSGGTLKVTADGEDVTSLIRTEKIAGLASAFSALPEMRGSLLGLQRRLGAGGGVVMDGRDIGTVIFPDAEVKIFLEASDGERSRRRWQELRDSGHEAPLEEVRGDLLGRDRRDSSRTHSPLRSSPDARVIDTTSLSPGEVVEKILEAVTSATGERK